MTMRKGTLARRTFDRALQALPVTQHDRIWKLYIQWARNFGVEETAIRVFRRYLMFDSAHREVRNNQTFNKHEQIRVIVMQNVLYLLRI